MVCENPVFNFDFWNNLNNESAVEVTCLMPNSVAIPLTVSTITSFHELKEVCLMLLLSILSNTVQWKCTGIMGGSCQISIAWYAARLEQLQYIICQFNSPKRNAFGREQEIM